ncbi:Histone H2AX [Podochytrium sp. JEL0797]|nr:Histone H2AX [Podochytrium sp. JEL0797]
MSSHQFEIKTKFVTEARCASFLNKPHDVFLPVTNVTASVERSQDEAWLHTRIFLENPDQADEFGRKIVLADPAGAKQNRLFRVLPNALNRIPTRNAAPADPNPAPVTPPTPVASSPKAPTPPAVKKSRKTRIGRSRSKRAGLQFPVGRIHRLLRKGNYAKRIGSTAPVYLASILEHLMTEMLQLAAKAARDNKKSRIVPRHLQLAIRNNEVLIKLLGNVTIAEGGVLPKTL